MEKSVIECIGRKEEIDKNGRLYVRLFFKNWKFDRITNPVTGEIVHVQHHSVVGHVNQYPESYTSSGRPDPYYMLQIGAYITGEVVQRKVEPYKTQKGFTIDYYNAVVFGDSTMSDWEDRIRRAFSKNGMKLLPNYVHKTFDVAFDEPPPKQKDLSSPDVRARIVAESKQKNILSGEDENINF